MQKSILKLLYTGDLRPCDMPPPSDPKYRLALEKSENFMNQCKEKLNAETFLVVEQLINAQMEADYIECLQSFVCGVQFGARLFGEMTDFKIAE